MIKHKFSLGFNIIIRFWVSFEAAKMNESEEKRTGGKGARPRELVAESGVTSSN